MTSISIEHDRAAGRYFAELDGDKAFLDYRQVDERTRDFVRTFVPEALRGRGIAGQLVRFALEDARAHGIKVIPTCSYVAATIQRDPSFADVVA